MKKAPKSGLLVRFNLKRTELSISKLTLFGQIKGAFSSTDAKYTITSLDYETLKDLHEKINDIYLS